MDFKVACTSKVFSEYMESKLEEVPVQYHNCAQRRSELQLSVSALCTCRSDRRNDRFFFKKSGRGQENGKSMIMNYDLLSTVL